MEQDCLNDILNQLSLTHAIQAFTTEKITVDIVGRLSDAEFHQLGIVNEAKQLELKEICNSLMDSENCPQSNATEVLVGLVDSGFSVDYIANVLSVSRRTVFRRLEKLGMSARTYSDIDETTLDRNLQEIMVSHPNSGEVMLKGFLKERGISVTRQRLRDAIHRVDREGPVARCRRRLHRRVYSVEGPNHLWHIDGNHKLLRWGFFVHGGVDGFSRLPVFMKCSTNNTSVNVLEAFHGAVELYGLPARVRTDAGGENVKVWQYMRERRGESGVIIGKSTHNQRIERLWKDVFEGSLHHFYQLFYHLEESEDLNHLDEVHLFAIQYVFAPRINISLQEWLTAWAHHRIRTVGGTPLQLWVDGQLQNPIGLVGGASQEHDVENLNEEELEEITSSHVTVQEPENPLIDDTYEQLKQEINPLRHSSQHGIDIYFDVIQFISNSLSQP